jgi:hypothetical protein
MNFELRVEAIPAKIPMRAAAWGPTKPDPGVMAARPANVPDNTSVIENFPDPKNENNNQTNEEVLAAM